LVDGRGRATRTVGRSLLWPVLLTVVVCVLVVLVALGGGRSEGRVGGPGAWGGLPNVAGDLLVVVGAVCLAFLVLLVYILWTGARGSAEDERPKNPFPVSWVERVVVSSFLLVFVGGVVTAFVMAVRRGKGVEPQELLIPGSGDSGLPWEGAENAGDSFVVHWWVLAGVGLVALAIVVAILVKRRFGRRSEPADRADPRSDRRERMKAAVEYSLEEIARDTDPRRAIIRAYVRMEQIFAQHGLGRLPHEAPREYLDRALAGIEVGRPAAERLTALFIRARFSDHAVDAELKSDAVAALTAVRDELGAVGA